MNDKGEPNKPAAAAGLERALEMAQSQLVSYARDFKQTIDKLRASEERLSIALETARDAIVIVDAERDGAITVWNRAAEALFGYSKDEAIGRGIHEFLVPPRLRAAAQAGMAHFATSGEGAAINQTLELPALHKNGTEFPIELSLAAMQIRGQWHAIGILRDIRERKAHEAQISNLNRALRTLSACNLALVHAQTEEELFQNVCRHIVETGGQQLAWVEYPGEAGGAPRFGAYFGDEAAYRCHAELALKPEHDSLCLTAIALRTRQTQASNRLQERPESQFDPLRAVGVQGILALPMLHNGDLHGALTIFSSMTDTFDTEEIHLMEQLATDLAYGIATLRTRAERDRIAHEHLHHAEILQKSLEQSIQAIADTVEARDPYTAGHQRRVSELAVAIARELGLPEEKIHGLRLAATIHDLGKVHIPAEILTKLGRLNDIEFMLIKTHPQSGYDILKDVDFPWPIADIVHQHHERLDGSGYPQGLKNGQILFEAKILAVADVVEAMASHRPYRPSLGIEAALQEIERGRASAYDPAAVDACLKLFREGRFAFSGGG